MTSLCNYLDPLRDISEKSDDEENEERWGETPDNKKYRSQTSPLYCTREPGGRTIQEPDLTLVLYKGTRRKNSTGARPHPCIVQGNQEEEQYRS